MVRTFLYSTYPISDISLGAGGLYFEYVFFADKFRSAVWTMTVTPDTPLTSLREMAAFYFAKIKEERPNGPYRLASYSASSLLLVVLVKLFEDNGDEVVQATMLDHFPAMFVHLANKFGNPNPRTENIQIMLDAGMAAIEGMMERDSNRDTLRRSKNLLTRCVERWPCERDVAEIGRYDQGVSHCHR